MGSLLKRLPNWLTLLRVALIPYLVVLLIEPTRQMLATATVVFVIAALTDYLDGFIARRWGGVSNFGKLLDPLADKILVMAALVMLAALTDDGVMSSAGRLISQATGRSLIPAWMVVLLLAREFWVTGLRAVAATQGTVVAARATGKVKSAVQMVAIVCILLFDYEISIAGYRVTAQFVGLCLLVFSIVVSYISAYEYTAAIFFPAEERGTRVWNALKHALLGERRTPAAAGSADAPSQATSNDK